MPPAVSEACAPSGSCWAEVLVEAPAARPISQTRLLAQSVNVYACNYNSNMNSTLSSNLINTDSAALTDRALWHRLLSALTSRWYNERDTHAPQIRPDRSDLRSAPRDGTSIAHDTLIGRTTNRVHDTIDGTSACSQIMLDALPGV